MSNSRNKHRKLHLFLRQGVVWSLTLSLAFLPGMGPVAAYAAEQDAEEEQAAEVTDPALPAEGDEVDAPEATTSTDDGEAAPEGTEAEAPEESTGTDGAVTDDGTATDEAATVEAAAPTEGDEIPGEEVTLVDDQGDQPVAAPAEEGDEQTPTVALEEADEQEQEEAEAEEAAPVAPVEARKPAKSATAAVVPTGANYNAAKAKFGVTDEHAYEATDIDEVASYLKIAGREAKNNSAPYIVHVTKGSWSTNKIGVPANVILVAEDAVTFTCNAPSVNNAFVTVNGALYGGSYDGAKKTDNVIYMGKGITFAGNNGIIQKVTVTNSHGSGITAYDTTKNVQIIDCTSNNNNENGINLNKGCHAKLIKDCTTNNNGYTGDKFSGINLSTSDVDLIEHCTIKSNADKAISTASTASAGCKIGAITRCTMVGNKQNGVYIKPNCSLNSFTYNTLENNKDGLVATGKSHSVTGKAIIKGVAHNTFTSNTNSNICAQYPGATVTVGSDNKATGGQNVVSAYSGGVVNVTGSNNVFSKASKGAGISVSGAKSKCVISGKGTKISSNKQGGIYIKNGSVSIKGAKTQILSNKKYGIYATKSTLNISGASTTIKKSTGSGIYATDSSKITIKGASLNVASNTDCGIAAVKKTKVTITGKKALITANKNAGIYANTSSVVSVTGKGTVISKNGTNGVYAAGKAKVTVKHVKFTKNKKAAKYAKGGAKISVKK